jgi:hypothetical protein
MTLAIARKTMHRSVAPLSQIVALVMIPVMLVSFWLHVQVLDNHRYSESMRHLGSDASFQQAFGDQVTRLLSSEITKLSGTIDTALIQPYVDDLGGIEGVYAAISSGVQALIHSPYFVQYWVQLNQLTHQQVVDFVRGESSVLSNDGRRGVSLDMETIALWLDPFTDDSASAVLSLAMADGATQVQIAQSRSVPLAEWVSRNALAVAGVATVLFIVSQILAITAAQARKHAAVIAAIGIAVVAAATVVGTKTVVSDHLASIRDAQGRALAHEYVDAVLSSLVALAGVLAVASLVIAAVILALPYFRQDRQADEVVSALPQA